MALTSFMTDTWLSAQGDEDKTVELAPSGFDVKSFPRQTRSRGGGIATVYKSTLGLTSHSRHTLILLTHRSNYCRHQLLNSITYNIFICLYRPPPNRRSNLTDYFYWTAADLNYVNNHTGFVCLVGDMNIHFDNQLKSLTKQTLTALGLHILVQVINKPSHRCGHIIHWVIVRPDDDIHWKSIVTDSLETDHYCT